MKRLKLISIILALFVSFLSAGTASMALDYGDYLNSAVEFIQDMFYQDMTDSDALKAALKGLFGVLDPYSGFFDDEETKQLNINLEGSFVGIGATLEECDEGIRIIHIYEDSPAERAGLNEGDIILGVDGRLTRGKDAESVASEIRGEEGTKVTLTVKRQSGVADIVIERGLVVINPVEFRFEGDIAYIHIDTFNGNTAEKFNEAMDAVERMGVKKILLDIRNNPGGFVDQAVAVARRLVPEGLITTLDFKSEILADRIYYSTLKNSPYIVAVLVDENTASAAEILASALQEGGNGVLIGQNTYGKGVVQNIFTVITPEAYEKYNKAYGMGFVTDFEWMVNQGVYPTADDILGTIKITTGHYLTRKGKVIEGVGLKPDIVVANRTTPNGVDISLVNEVPNIASLALNSYDPSVYQAEKILRAADYFAGIPDRLYDADTQEAVKRFQKAKGLPQTGQIDAATRVQLNNLLITLRAKNDPQYLKALEFLALFNK